MRRSEEEFTGKYGVSLTFLAKDLANFSIYMKIIRRLGSVASIKRYAPLPKSQEAPQAPKTKFELKRHPVMMDYPLPQVLNYRLPNRPLAPLYEVPLEARMPIFPYFESPPDSCFMGVAVVGPPNAGKSTLVNTIIGQKVLAVSRKVNTTNDTIEALKTDDKTQMLFYDTPGILSTHGPRTNAISTKGWTQVHSADFTLFVVDSIKVLRNDVRTACKRLQKLLEPQSQQITEAQLEGESDSQFSQRQNLASSTIPAALVMTKVDLVKDRRSLRHKVNELHEYAKFEKVFYVSAEHNYNVEQVYSFLKGKAPEGEWLYHPQQVTNLSDVEKVEQIIREELLNWYHEELPYSWKLRTVGWTPYLDGTLRIDTEVLVHSQIQIGIFLGKQSRTVKKVCESAKAKIIQLYQRPVKLVLKAKLAKDHLTKEVERNQNLKVSHPRLESITQFPKETLNLLSGNS